MNEQPKTTIKLSSSDLAVWWRYLDEVRFGEDLGDGVKSLCHRVDCKKMRATGSRFPFRYLVNTSRCLYVGGPGGIVAFVKDGTVVGTLRDFDLELALLKERQGAQQEMLDTHLKYKTA